MYMLLITCITFSYGVCKTMGPVGTISISTLGKCEDESESDDFKFELDLKSDSDGNKAIFAKLENKIAIDDTITYKADFRSWENSGWKPKLQREGKFCEDFSKFGPKLWEKLQSNLGGDFPSECPIQPGTYNIENYQAISTDFNVPTIFYGQLWAQLKLFKDKTLICCVVLEGNSQAPS